MIDDAMPLEEKIAILLENPHLHQDSKPLNNRYAIDMTAAPGAAAFLGARPRVIQP